jgi:putative ABC transport system permease protein
MMASKLRTSLTVLGIVIGIASVIVVMSAGKSAQSLILDQVRNVGSNLIVVLPGESEEDGPPAIAYGIAVTTLTEEDVQAIANRENIPYVTAASGYATGNAVASYKSERFSVNFNGVSPSYIEVENAKIADGRFFTEEENDSVARVAVLGASRARDLFGRSDPIGERFSLGQQSFRVVGVLAERGFVAFSNPDSEVFIPLSSAQRLVLGIDYLSYARIRIDDETNIERAKGYIEQLLRDRHNIETEEPSDFSVRSAAATLDILKGVTDALSAFLIGVASVALLVGGVGIMNILLISLKQRVRDIGLRKALGALDGDIFLQFLVESVVISLAGTAIGVAMGMGITFLAAIVIQSMGYAWTFSLTLESVGLAFGIALLIGILFGLYPARKATKISPTEALRYE